MDTIDWQRIDWSAVIAAFALLFSVFATARTHKLAQSQKRLNQLLLEREEQAASSKKRADLSANLVKIGGTNWVLKVFNKGDATARNVTLEMPSEDGLLMPTELREKFPLEILDDLAPRIRTP